MSAPGPVITPELRSLLRTVKLGQLMATLPERLALARARGLSHAEFLELLLSDEVTRRDATSAQRRARQAGLDPAMRLEHFDDQAKITYDRQVFDELFSLRFIAAASNALIMGPVGTGKTFVATALGHAAIRRRHSVHFERADQLFKRLKAARLDNSHDAEIRKLLHADLLILDLSRAWDYPDVPFACAWSPCWVRTSGRPCRLRIGIIAHRPTILCQRSEALRGRRNDGHDVVDAERRALGPVRGRVLAGAAEAGSSAGRGEASSGADEPAQPLAVGRGPCCWRPDTSGGRAVPGLAEGAWPAARAHAGIPGAAVWLPAEPARPAARAAQGGHGPG
jgi:hypothetical protein